MTQPNQVIGLPVSFDAYLRHGWKLVAIPQGSKGPHNAGWNKRDHAVTDSAQVPPGYGVGLAHAYSGTCAIDIDDWGSAMSLMADQGISLTALYNALDAVTIESGREGRGKLLYRMPFGITLPSKKVNYTTADGSKAVSFELRCASTSGLTVQDVLPPTIHPVTNLPYRWGGKGQWSSLPTIPPELLNLWQEMCKQDSERVIATDTIDASWDDIRTALYTIPADTTRENWLTALMALHHAGTQVGQVDQAQALAHEWSATGGEKYKGAHDFNAVWRSIKADSNGIKTGSLFHVAQKYGYKRPMPDVSDLFKATPPPTPPAIVSDQFRLPMPDMDMSWWPKILTDCANEVSASVGCDPLVPLWAGLGAVCGVVDSQIRLELMPKFRVPPILWLMTVGDPGDKKSPGSRPMMGVLRQLEQEDKRRYKRSFIEWEALDHVYQTSRKAHMVAAAQSTNTILTGKLDSDALPPVADEGPTKPVDLRIVVDDITSQKLVRIAADRPRGLLCHLDEMANWVQKVTDPRSGEDRSCWTKSYESDPYSMDRVGLENTVYAKNMAVSIFGNIQPQVFKNRFKSMADDGLLQRFIPACLRPNLTKRGDPVPDALSMIPAWEMKLRELFTLPSVTYRLDSGAYQLYRDFQLWYETNKSDERLLRAGSIYMQAYGKLEGTCGRIALVIHLIENPYSPVVSADIMRRSIEICRYYLIPAYRYALGETAGLLDDSLEKWCMERVIQLSGIADQISMADIRRCNAQCIKDIPRYQLDQAIHDAMEPLERAHWVTVVNDHHTKKTWAINPSLKLQHADHNLAVIKAKQRRMDEIWQNLIRKGYPNPRRTIVAGYDPATMDGT